MLEKNTKINKTLIDVFFGRICQKRKAIAKNCCKQIISLTQTLNTSSFSYHNNFHLS